MTNVHVPTSLVGGGILDLVTTGMYNNPLAIYREYVQNAADAIETSGNISTGKVEIKLDPSAMCVRIRDNGPGLSPQDAIETLLAIARSRKQRGIDRGFRGVGRLCGLAFAESVTFLTRACGNTPVSRITWNGPKLRKGIYETERIEDAILECVCVEAIPGKEHPDHFFEVEVAGVARHSAGLLLNRDAVRAYVAEACPVPMADEFQFAEEVRRLLRRNGASLTLEIRIDDDTQPVTRPYGSGVRFAEAKEDAFTTFEEFHIPSADGSEKAAVGWIAHSSYLGVIPKETGIRGIRARDGDLQIGDDTVFEDLFPEGRFNRWCVGEVHILDPRIVPNGRRDYFEPSPHTRNLENHLGAIFHRIATQCRRASAARNNGRRVLTAIQRIEEAYELATTGYLEAASARDMVASALMSIPDLRKNIKQVNGGTKSGEIDELERKLRSFSPKGGRPPFPNTTREQATVYQKVFGTLARVHESPRAAKEIIEAVLAYA